MDNTEILIKVIKQQAEVFLLDAREFFPFGTYINSENKVVPFSAYIEDADDRPESQPLIDLLEKTIQTKINNREGVIGALAFDVFINDEQGRFDGMIIRIIENDILVERRFKYTIHENHVDFTDC